MILETHWGITKDAPQSQDAKPDLTFPSSEEYAMAHKSVLEFARKNLLEKVFDDVENKYGEEFSTVTGFSTSDYNKRVNSQSNKFRAGVLHGDEVTTLLNYANENNFAIPAVNVIGTNSVNVVLETAREVTDQTYIESLHTLILNFYDRRDISQSDRIKIEQILSELTLNTLSYKEKISLLKWNFKRMRKAKEKSRFNKKILWQILPIFIEERAYTNIISTRKKVERLADNRPNLLTLSSESNQTFLKNGFFKECNKYHRAA